ncbi:MAG: YtxH domain-containing protein [Tannerella sp.]|jgi:gas vesicle protein|nr:YtxH domain-containing protein [Tannerella sp.]
MKGNVDSRLLLGFVIGAAIGATVGYLAATDKKEQILEELNEIAGKVKESFNSAVAKYKERKIDAETTCDEAAAKEEQ